MPEKSPDALEVVLAHEGADFDSIAALHAAGLLNPDAVPVLPRKLNRNVRAFLNLYQDRLPLVDPADLPRTPINRITLVDTQSLITLKGMQEDTEIRVIDHHPRNPDLPRNWDVHIEELGATTTMLVESLQEANIELDSIDATLLLLGIYEDTGSLSYAGTNPRDVSAAAWLLEQGAELQMASDFLNQPLSEGQRRLYESLVENAETVEYHGLTVVITTGVAGDLTEEISPLAHKLRDVFEVAGLFVLVSMNGSVQMVARSTTDSLDVGKVAEHFGGGGHNRAAAALIREMELESIKQELVSRLAEAIEPVKTVGEIMSRGPQLLNPEVTVEQASTRMQRYGHEGYPVLAGGKVVGLLTRRAVDRALAHGMGDRPVTEIMEAGQLAVKPGDSIRHLQRLMMEHDWGQVPVVDPEGGEVIGIVTRTDLLKTLSRPEEVEEPRLSERLESALPPARLALLKTVGTAAEEYGVALYVVGGFVRDLLLETPSVDFDLVVEGDAIGLARALTRLYGGRVSTHRRFGTAKWQLDATHPELQRALGMEGDQAGDLPAYLDLVSARTEFYTHPTALPSVTRGSIKLDLHRRDFSINTLALRLDGRFYGQLLDYWGGGRDLRDGVIRVLHSLSFVDDPTRMLRAVRLEQRLKFTIESRTLELLQNAIPLLERVSGERIRSELQLIFDEEALIPIMERLSQLDLLRAIHPRLTWDPWLADRFHRARGFTLPTHWEVEGLPTLETILYALWAYRFDVEQAEQVCERLHLPQALRSVILEAGRLGCDLSKWPEGLRPSEVVHCVGEQGDGSLLVVWIAEAQSPNIRDAIEGYFRLWKGVEPHTDGDDLRQMGLPPGPAYREILWTLRAAWLDGEVSSTSEEQQLLERLLGQHHEG